MFDWLGGLLKKIWEFLGPILAICAIVLIVFAPYLVGVLGAGTLFAASLPAWLSWIPALVSAAAALGPVACALGGIGLAYALDPSGTAAIVTGAAALVGSTVGTVAGSTAGALVSSSGLGSLLWLAVAGVGVYFLLSSDDGDKDEEPQTTNYSPRRSLPQQRSP